MAHPQILHLARLIEEIQAREPRACPGHLPQNTGLDSVLGTLPAASLLELIGMGEGAGVWTFALLLAREHCPDRAMVVVDPHQVFFPFAALQWGMDLSRLILIRPRTAGLGLSAMNRALRCTSIGAVIAWCDHLKPSDNQRLRLAVEEGGGLGILLRPQEALVERSFATLRMQLCPLSPEAGEGNVIRGIQKEQLGSNNPPVGNERPLCPLPPLRGERGRGEGGESFGCPPSPKVTSSGGVNCEGTLDPLTPALSREAGEREKSRPARKVTANVPVTVSPYHPVTLSPALASASGSPVHRRIQVNVLRGLGSIRKRSFRVEIDDEKGHVRLLPQLAAAAASLREAHPA